MKKSLASAALVASVGAATLLTGCATGGFPNRVHYINHDKVAATFVKGGRIIEDEGLTVLPTAACSAAPKYTPRPIMYSSSSTARRTSLPAAR